MDKGRADAGWSGRVCLARKKSQAQTGTGTKTISLYSRPRAGLATIPDEFQSCICDDHIHTHKSGFGKREAYKNCSMVIPEKGAPVSRSTLKTSGPVPPNSRP